MFFLEGFLAILLGVLLNWCFAALLPWVDRKVGSLLALGRARFTAADRFCAAPRIGTACALRCTAVLCDEHKAKVQIWSAS